MKLPFNFKAQAQTTSGIQSTWMIESYGQNAMCAIPAEFNGPGGGFSPEDLFAQALTNCLIATFKVYAENSNLFFDDIHIQTELTVDKDDDKKTVMKSCHFKIHIKNPTHIDKATILIKKAFESGFILNSVKTKLTYNLI